MEVGGGKESQDALLFVSAAEYPDLGAASCPWSGLQWPVLPLQADPGWQLHSPKAPACHHLSGSLCSHASLPTCLQPWRGWGPAPASS